ncbi:hypothetical protein Tco_0919608, partial [Tanacetum coccineum]
ELAELHECDTHDLYALLKDAQDRDGVDGGGGSLCFPRGLGTLDRIELGDSSGASYPLITCMYMRPIFRHTRRSYSCRGLSFRHSIRHQDQMVETLRVIKDIRQEMSGMQAELLAL